MSTHLLAHEARCCPGGSQQTGDIDMLGHVSAIHLRKPVYDDWERVHEWGQTIEACRYQPWGPNTAEETQAFLSAAIDTWDDDESARSRYVWIAEAGELGVIGLGELKVLSPVCQGDVRHLL